MPKNCTPTIIESTDSTSRGLPVMPISLNNFIQTVANPATLPVNTHIIVTADHGELFGELGYFGHGPIMHDKVFEVPYLEGKIR